MYLDKLWCKKLCVQLLDTHNVCNFSPLVNEIGFFVGVNFK